MRPLQLGVSGPTLGGPVPLACAPIVAQTPSAMLAQARDLAHLPDAPDLVELRADHLSAPLAAIPDLLLRLREALPTATGARIPILFTNRRQDEGGAGIWAEPDRLASIAAAISSGAVALVDVELAVPDADRQRVIQLAQAAGVGVIVSAHDFAATPDDARLAALFAALSASGADVAKLAVTANTPDDALRLLRATARAAQAAPVPLAAMALGPQGAITRLAGPYYGSALTYAAAGVASAPGQLPLALVRDFWRQVGLRL